MAAERIDFRHFILGLLAQEPMSGYDINRFLKGLSWLIGKPSFGSLYPALHALLANGLVTVNVVTKESKPPRKIYSISDAGRRQLQQWSERPVAPDTPMKAFVMRLILGSTLTHDRLIAHLQQRRARVSENLTLMERMASQQDEAAEWSRSLALDYGLALAAAEVGWLDQALERLAPQPPP
jgi:PadR family transcriptional regulator AphA